MRKHIILLGVVLLVVAGLAALAINKYEHSPHKPTLIQAEAQKEQALIAVSAEKSINNNDNTKIANLEASNSTLTSNNAKLCTQIKAARLVQPICQ